MRGPVRDSVPLLSKFYLLHLNVPRLFMPQSVDDLTRPVLPIPYITDYGSRITHLASQVLHSAIPHSALRI